MIRNYFKIAWRNLIKNKGYSLINIGGLSIGMSCSILIFLWVQDETSYDKFHTNANQICRLTVDAGSGDFKAAVSPAGMASGLQDEISGIESTVRISKPITSLFEANDLKFEEQRVFYVDANFLEMFDFSLLKGDVKTALQNPNGILITETTAIKYFGSEDALGKFIKKDNNDVFTITGILADTPSNSHLQFDIILPMAYLAKTDRGLINNTWSDFNFYSYIQFNKGHNLSFKALVDLEDKVNQVYASRSPKFQPKFKLQPLTDIHLHSSNLQIDLSGHGNIQYVNIFIIIALIVLLVACINFMNLATAQSSRRAKEVGLRKVIGAKRNQLIFQFLSESILISFISLFIAICIIYLVMPLFNNLTEKQIVFQLLDNKVWWLYLIFIGAITGLISGSYPALFLSSFKPIKTIKGRLGSNNENLIFRNGLVITQFVVSVFLLVGTVVVYKQLNFIKDKNLGFDKSNLLYVPAKGEIYNKRGALKTLLQQNPLTSNFSMVSDLPTNLISGATNVKWEGKDPNSLIVFPSMYIDENFTDVFQTEILRGRGFSETFGTDASNYVINEKAMEVMGMNLETVIGNTMTFQNKKGTIIGVVKDFNFKSLQYAIEPLVLHYTKESEILVVRTQPGKTEATIKALKEIYGNLNPAFPFVYNFVDKDLDNQYRGEQRMGTVFNLFAILAIFISCIGLYGLSAFIAEQRIKEIGIRKVLGASVFGLVNMLSKDFFKLVLIALLIASPIAWYLMDMWLQDFAFHIDIHWWMFALSGMIIVVIALITVSFQTIKAAIVNPIKSLRTE
ncbi:ABC transporter permease [Flavivirga eckloniae]|uniref:ABC transporter permease n=1 Tax=Flavivirga eckloniae TaxID=1803846 RepID=A0A2K9PN49_9FLAO|nr:ABC transporter permease [Flavivirga eckloniae]AUP78482.1 ABC transporter permease [Flavivirga eckloniae]